MARSQSKLRQVKQLEEKLARALADYHNLEKRFQQESTRVVRFANQQLLRKLLDFRDDLERAVQALQDQGLKLVLQHFDKILEQEQVKEIQALNQPFDPQIMEVEEVVQGETNKVIQVTRKGYLLHDRLLRPAKVKVGSGQANSKIKNDKKLSTNN